MKAELHEEASELKCIRFDPEERKIEIVFKQLPLYDDKLMLDLHNYVNKWLVKHNREG